MVGDGVTVGVGVIVGVNVTVAVGVLVGVGVIVHACAVAVITDAVPVAESSADGPQAEIKIAVVRIIRNLFTWHRILFGGEHTDGEQWKHNFLTSAYASSLLLSQPGEPCPCFALFRREAV